MLSARHGTALKPIQPGERFARQWLVDNVFREERPAVPVRWPQPARSDATGAYIDFGESRLPDLLDIAVYDTVGADGQPDGKPSLNRKCTPAQGTCRQRLAGRSILYVALQSKNTRYIGVSAIWYLPPRPAAEGPVPRWCRVRQCGMAVHRQGRSEVVGKPTTPPSDLRAAVV
jgi:hypothetical protein